MKTLHSLVLALALAGAGTAQSSEPALSPAENAIELARRGIEKDPGRFQGHNALALAFARRARETADPAFYARAGEALAKSLELAPENFEARKLRVWIRLGEHEFARAREEALRLNAEFPDDVLVYGFLVDANVELGRYDEAEVAAQWMLDIRPGNLPGTTRAAYLRELFGDAEGAIELFESAFHALRPQEVEDRAWVLTQIANLRRSRGEIERAETIIEQALELFPDYHYALAVLARVKLAQGDEEAAIERFRKRHELAPHPENLFDLAVALELGGRSREAREAFERFEEEAQAESMGWDNANRELVDYYLEHAAGTPAERARRALALTERELARRRDVFTLEIHARALAANGRLDEARETIEEALEVGILDARMLFHAAEIAGAQGEVDAAVGYYVESLDTNGRSEVAERARAALQRLRPAALSR